MSYVPPSITVAGTRFDLRVFDDPVLKVNCLPLRPDGRAARELTRALKRAVVAFNGVGLAAPQIGIPARAIAIRPTGAGGAITMMLNPEIIEHSEIEIPGFEMCLSYPGVRAPTVKRWTWIKVRCIDPKDGATYVRHCNNFTARIIQHEIDHLDGICRVGDVWREKIAKRETAEVPA